MILGLFFSWYLFFVVEVAPGVDEEGLEVAKECLKESFKITSDSTRDYKLRPVSLVNVFTSLDKTVPSFVETTRGVTISEPSSSSSPNLSDSQVSVNASKEPLFTSKY